MTDHDRLFKELLTTFFVEFIELFLPGVAAYFDGTSLVAMDKEIFTDVTLGERREVDILMRAKFKGLDTFFLLHLENQATAQSDFGRRMFTYFARLHEKYTYPVYPIVLFSYDIPKRAEPDSYLVEFPDKKVLEFNYTVIQLNQLNWRDYLNKPNPVASALMAKMKIEPKDRPRVKLECLRMLVELKLDPAKNQLVSGFVGNYLYLNEIEATKFDSSLYQTGLNKKEEVMEIVTDWGDRGMKTEAVAITLRLLKKLFGPLPTELEQKVKKLEREQLEDLSEALLDFSEISQMEAWLKAVKAPEKASARASKKQS